jgi:transcription initiation factor TFIIIB Brf1 subunit/transcription initiation factor TFIIB
MAKCPNCPQFTGKNVENDPEDNLEVSDDGVVTGTVRIYNACEECGTELEETTFDVEIDLSDLVAEHRKECKNLKEKGDGLSLSANVSRTDEAGRDRYGKPIANPRYRKRMYGIEVEAHLTCDACGEQFADGDFEDSVQASGMEWIA